jgi:2-polyprenyl-3-methyl-5-hydroxy-6-metoxy-1,4-benzoquinol methylase
MNTQTETEQVATFFEGYASGFDSIYGHAEKRNGFQKIVDRLFRQTMFTRFQETLKHTADASIASVVDIGCGPGHYCAAFLKQNKKVLGMDLSEEMLKIGKQHTDSIGPGKQIEFIKADYLSYPLNEKYDAACLMGFFDYISKPVDILVKLKKEIRKEIYASFPKSGGPLAFQRRIRYRLRHCPLYMYSREEVVLLIKSAGFQEYEIKDCKRDWYVRIFV